MSHSLESTNMQKPAKFVPALYGGIIMGVISAVPFLNFINCLCCAGILFGGFMAVFFYKNNFTPDTPPFSTGDCLAVGALAGLIGAVVATALDQVFMMLFGNILRDFIFHLLDSMNLDIPQEALDEIRRRIEETPTGIVSIFVDLVFGLILYTIFGLLGGLIGYAVWKPNPPVMQTPGTHS